MSRTILRIYPFLLIFLLLMALSSTAQEAPSPLAPDSPVSGSFDNSSAADVYSFDALADSVITLSVSSDDSSLGLLLSDSSGAILAEATGDDSGEFSLSDFALGQTGSYFVTIFTSPGSEGSYELTLSLLAPETEATEPEVAPTETSEAVQTGDIVTELPDTNDVLLNNGMEVRLQWSATVDLNLEVRDPVGNTLHFDSRTSTNGGTFGFDANGFCEVISEAPVETATWRPGFLPTGSYEILVFYQQTCEGTAQAVPFSVTVTVNGQVLPAIEAIIAPPPTVSSQSVYLANFVLENETSAILNEGGPYPDTALNQLPAPFADLSSQAVALERNVPVPGAIFEAQDFIVYSLEAEANETISVSMSATSRNLDTLVQLIDPNGNLLAVSDDTTDSTNSLIPNARILQTGTYLVVATRYGKDLGGTEGEFTLIVTESAGLDQNLLNLALPEGDIQIYLTWNTNADLQLLVRDPVGQSVYDDSPQVSSGGILAADGNVNCIQEDGDPVSYIYWPTGLQRPGTYEVDVWFENTCEDNNVVQFTLTIVVGGQVVVVERQSPVIGNHFVMTFTVNADGTATTGLAGFTNSGITPDLIANEEVLPISFNVPQNGTITIDNPFDVYEFEGEAGQIVTITMQRASGTVLDTNVYLLSDIGIQLANNDDAPEGAIIGADDRSTDSVITTFTLPATGTYQIVATHFGNQFGGTTGNYQLTIQVNEQ
jgi:uncharacterized protein YfaP (DUF2135 family)